MPAQQAKLAAASVAAAGSRQIQASSGKPELVKENGAGWKLFSGGARASVWLAAAKMVSSGDRLKPGRPSGLSGRKAGSQTNPQRKKENDLRLTLPEASPPAGGTLMVTVTILSSARPLLKTGRLGKSLPRGQRPPSHWPRHYESGSGAGRLTLLCGRHFTRQAPEALC